MQAISGSEYWPGWLSGLVLSALLIAYFWSTGRYLSSSGRISILVDQLRGCPPTELEASPQELAEAIRRASIEAFGAGAVADAEQRAAHERQAARVAVRPRAALTWVSHVVFLVGLVLGGRLAFPSAPLAWTLGEGVWAGKLVPSALPYALAIAGVLIGFGTRMAGGCPIGHGLCGMARGQSGSWAAGLAFFGAGVALSLAVFGP